MVNFFQGLLAEAESMFSKMKMAGYSPDVIAYTTMIHAYSTAGKTLILMLRH